MATAQVNGIELYYEVHGTGPPLVLIPGLGGDVRLFAGVLPALAEACRVVAFDPRGAGRSEKPDAPDTIDAMADDAAGLLDELGVAGATVVGYSMGGRIALSLALGRPDLAGRLVLAATSARTPPTRLLGRRWFVMEVLTRLPLPKGMDPQPRFAFEHQRRASQAFDCTDRLGRIRVPALVLHGRDDHIVPYGMGVEMERALPQSRLVTVPGGHLALLTTQGHRFVEEIRTFAST